MVLSMAVDIFIDSKYVFYGNIVFSIYALVGLK